MTEVGVSVTIDNLALKHWSITLIIEQGADLTNCKGIIKVKIVMFKNGWMLGG